MTVARDALAGAMAASFMHTGVRFGEMADAAIVALAEAGFVIVPVEPTEAMIAAGERTIVEDSTGWGSDYLTCDMAAKCFKNMLTAALAAKET